MPTLSEGKKGSKPTCAWIWEKFEICRPKWEALFESENFSSSFKTYYADLQNNQDL
jgi:hypothetical protein